MANPDDDVNFNTGTNYTGAESAFINTPMGQPLDYTTTTVPNSNRKLNVNVNKTPGVRTWNPLGEYSSYTYQISLYIITPDAYDIFVASGRTQLNVINNLNTPCQGSGAYLIAQSGGINDNSSVRAAGFDFDYYIDNLKMEGAINPAQTGGPAFNYEISFNVIEPYGFSFVSNLKRAHDAIEKYSSARGFKKVSNAQRQFFILGVKFLGYDVDGNIIQNSGQTFQRYYDIVLKTFKFKIDGKAVNYSITAAPTPIKNGMYVKKGMIDKGAPNLKGSTVGEVLQSLADKLNKDQENFKEKTTYKFEFKGENSDQIAKASIVSKADVEKSKWVMSKIKSQAQVTPATAEKSTPLSTERIISFEREIPIVQAISQIVAQSTYLTDGLKLIYKTTDEPAKKDNGYSDITLDAQNNVSWISVNPVVSNPRWDSGRNDWVFDLTYEIRPYLTPVMINPVFISKLPRYYGPYKKYKYWYTGENSEIIRLDFTFNNTYFTTALSEEQNAVASTKVEKLSPVAIAYSKRTPVARTGKDGVGLEAQNTYVTSLYDPGTWADVKIEILGDPDLLAWPTSSGNVEPTNPFYDKDGVTINPNAGQPYIEINFNEAFDYNHETGTMDINESIFFIDYPPTIKEMVDGVSFQIKKVTSVFRSGKFTQDLELILNTFADETSRYNQEAAQREEAQKPFANENAKFSRQQEQAKLRGFQAENTSGVENSGGDPCVYKPENQSKSLSADDDSNVNNNADNTLGNGA